MNNILLCHLTREVTSEEDAELEIKLAHYHNTRFDSSTYDIHQILQLELGIKQKIDISKYYNSIYNYRQMNEIRKGLIERLDISIYSNPSYNSLQMYHLRKGLEENLDVSLYAHPSIPWHKMRQVYLKLTREKKRRI